MNVVVAAAARLELSLFRLRFSARSRAPDSDRKSRHKGHRRSFFWPAPVSHERAGSRGGRARKLSRVPFPKMEMDHLHFCIPRITRSACAHRVGSVFFLSRSAARRARAIKWNVRKIFAVEPPDQKSFFVKKKRFFSHRNLSILL